MIENKENNNKIYQCLITEDEKVGIEFTDYIINIYFPLGYRLPEKNNSIEEKKSILDLISTLDLCRDDNSFEMYDINSGFTNKIPINSYLWIINDYLKNGLFMVNEKKYIQSQNGKINWKRTLKTKPIFDNDSIIYLNPVTEIKTQNDSIITEIHAMCVNISIKKIGWLFGEIPLIDNYKCRYEDSFYLDVLNTELFNTFNDNKKTLIKHLINIINEKNENEKLDIVNNLLVRNYHRAWEKMIDTVFGNVVDKREFFPEIRWNLRNTYNPDPSMRPDTIICDNDKIYIIDAKYYERGVIPKGSLPGADSVDKQLTYGEYNESKTGQNNVYNAFVMPFDMNYNGVFKSEMPIKSIGTVGNVGRKKGKLYEDIVVLLLDTNYLIDLYFERNNSNGINDYNKMLIKSITDEITIT